MKKKPDELLTRDELRDMTSRLVSYLSTERGKMRAYNAFRLWPTKDSGLAYLVNTVLFVKQYEHVNQLVARLTALHGRHFTKAFECAKNHQLAQYLRLEVI